MPFILIIVSIFLDIEVRLILGISQNEKKNTENLKFTLFSNTNIKEDRDIFFKVDIEYVQRLQYLWIYRPWNMWRR